MFIRSKTWQNAIIQSETQLGWENVIVLDYPCVDLRFKLKGYGWKPDPAATNLVILYAGRYECYYRERGTTEWIHFDTVISERASVTENRVYADCFATLGVVQDRIYEVKIIAGDAAKFQSWGGVLEGISQGEKFYYDLKIRAHKPIRIGVADGIKIQEYSYAGTELFSFSIEDGIKLQDIVITSLVYQTWLYESITTEESLDFYLGIGLNFYESISLEVVLDIELLINLVPDFEGLMITEYTDIVVV